MTNMGSTPDATSPTDDAASELQNQPSAQITLATIRESPRAPGRYQLLLSDGRKFVVGIQAMSSLGLTRTGIVLNGETIAQLSRESAISALTARAIAMLARARRTRRELERRLQRIEPDRVLVAEALKRLDDQGILGDDNVARAEASARLRRGDGPARVRQELRRKGLDDRTTSTALRDAIEEDGFDEVAACRRIAERRYRSLERLERSVARRRLTGFLLRRGYGSTTIQQVVKELMASHH
jgi:regulatory protein